MTDGGPAPWWAALESHGLDHLSVPELAHALQELACDRTAFLGVLAAASDYPRVGLCSQRRPDGAQIAGLERSLPRSRAVVLPEDEIGLRAALGAFEVLLVLDPLWRAPDLFYASWHATEGMLPEHARGLHRMLAPAVRLSAARDALHFIPDHLPASWDPFPTPPTASGAPALRRAAALLYWADRLQGVAVSGAPGVAEALRDLARAGPDLRAGTGSEVGVLLLDPPECASRPRPRPGWGAAFDSLVDDPVPLAHLLAEPSQAGRPWCLGLGAPALPDVSLALRRAQAGRPILSGIPGVAFPLARRPAYLVPDRS